MILFECVTFRIFENKITNIINIPKIKTEYPDIYAPKDVSDCVENPIISATTDAIIQALYIVKYQTSIYILK